MSLRIHRLRASPAGGWIVRFGGDDAEFWQMVHDLKWSGCRYDPHTFGKKRGGWIVSEGTLHSYRGRFENYQQAIEREQERQRVEQRRRELAIVEQVRRELGITRDINEVPF